MDLVVSPEAEQFGDVVRRAIADEGLTRARAAIAGDIAVQRQLAQQLSEIGVFELNLDDNDEALAAALAVYEVGRVAGAVPVVAMLTARAAGREGVMHAVAGASSRQLVNFANEYRDPWLIDASGRVYESNFVGGLRTDRVLAPYAGFVASTTAAAGDPRWWALHETFSAFESLGAIDMAIEIARAYARDRITFGKPLKERQFIQDHYDRALYLSRGLWELAYYTLWRCSTAHERCLPDALVLRAYHLEVLTAAFRATGQIFGAIGFCDEHDFSVYLRAVQFRRYVPLDYSRTMDQLARRMDDVESMYPVDA